MTAPGAPGWAWALGLAVLGAIIGSFLATIVVRWPAGRSVHAGRSACDGCGRTLGPSELVPLLSYLAARGRCRSCGAAIDRDHPRIEAAAAAIGAAAGAFVPGLGGGAWAGFGWLLLPLFVLDLRHFWLPDRLTLILALGGAALGGLASGAPLTDRLLGGAVGFASLALVGWLYRRLRGRDGLGGGDPKLFGAIGLWLGWQPLPFVLLAASLTGLAVAGLAGGLRGDRAVPFGAALAAAAAPGWLLFGLLAS